MTDPATTTQQLLSTSQWIGLLVAAVAGAASALLMKVYKAGPWLEDDLEPLTVDQNQPVQPSLPPEPTPAPKETLEAPERLLFDTPKNAWHSTRVLCDEAGLTYREKNLICACIYQESRFDNRAVGRNKNSTDWGIVQVNDTKGWHIGPGLQFPSVQYVKDHPDECVRWIIRCYKAGKLILWASYTSGAYQQWLPKTSPMWKLAVDNG